MMIGRWFEMLFGSSALQLLLLAGLVTARAVPMLFLNPLLGGNTVPAQVKIGLSLCLAFFVVPQLRGQAPVLQQGASYWLLFGKESLIGFGLGFAVLLLFQGVASAGRFIDIQRGANFADVLVFQTGERETHVGQLYLQLAQATFLVTGGHLAFLGAFCRSYLTVPPWGGLAAGALSGDGWLAAEFIRLSTQVLLIVVQLSAPVLLALLLVDAGGAIVHRVAPNLGLSTELAPAKLLLGLGVVCLMLPFSTRLMVGYWNTTTQSVDTIIHWLRP